MDKIELVLKNALERAGNELAGVRLGNLRPEDNFFGGKGSVLDSLNLVAFIFILEEEFEKVTGKKIKVSTQDILSKEACPFRNLKILQAWLSQKESELL